MIFCRSCGKAWPKGSARCGSCGGSFGGRRCPKDHLSPSAASRCVVCGSDELTEPTPSLELGCVSRLLAWLCVPLIAKLLWSNLDAVLGAAPWMAGGLTRFVFGTDLPQVFWSLIIPLVNLIVLAAVLSAVCPGFRKQVPGITKASLRAVRFAAKASLPQFRALWRRVVRLVQGDTHAEKKHR